MSCRFCSKNTRSSVLHSWIRDHVTFSCLVDVTVCAEDCGALPAFRSEPNGGAALGFVPIVESQVSASCPVVQKRAVWGARRVLLLSSQEVFSDEGQAALPLENPEAMGRFPPAVTSVLGWRRARGLATGGSFPLFLEKCG